MKRRTWLLGVVAVVALAGAIAFLRGPWSQQGAVAQAPRPAARAISINVGKAVRRMTPVHVAALGNVTPMASVAVKPRVDSEILQVHFADGASVKQGEVLLTLDSRAIRAQIQQAEGNVARDQAQLEGAERDLRRYTELVSKGATPITNLDNTKTQVAMFSAAKVADEAQLANLRVQLSYTTIQAPITGRISAATVKVGNFVRSADLAPIATIIQTSPIYVTFTITQGTLPDIRKALAAENAIIEATIPGEERRSMGSVTMVENSIDAGTGMAVVRATMPNTDELLWPGTLVTIRMTLREEEAVVVPAAAVQVSQTGSFVYVVEDSVARVQPVKVSRALGQETVIASGLNGDETVVTDGHLLLTNGARVAAREPRAGS